MLGDGPQLVLVNGYAATKDDWDPTFLDALGSRFSILAPDNRGMGDSELGDEPLTVEGMADDMLTLLDERGIERAAVVGWSMGGFVAQQLARAATARVEALVLLSTDGGGPEAIRGSPEAWARLTDHEGTPREQASRLIAVLFPPEVAEVIDRDFGEVVAEARAALSVRALAAQEEAMDAWHEGPASVLPEALPILVATGSEDEVIPPANSLALASSSRNSWLARFRGGGHAFMAQEPQRLASLIGAFLGR